MARSVDKFTPVNNRDYGIPLVKRSLRLIKILGHGLPLVGKPCK
jgi:hypothetical protein